MSETGQQEFAPVRTVDLTGDVCPMTFMKAKMHLGQIEGGQVLELVLKKGEQMQDVPKRVKEEGHRIVEVLRDGELFRLRVRKGE